jgi:Caspase domain
VNPKPFNRCLVVLVLLVCWIGFAPPSSAGKLFAPGGGDVRAIIVGIDQYRKVNQLRGAVADARDIETALRSMGATDVTALVNEQADRASVLRELEALLVKTKPGDLIILTIAGHGAQEDERVKGSSPDGKDEVFLLVGFDPATGPTASEKILNHEFNHYIKLLEARGGQIIFVADTCYGGGLAREVDPRAQQVIYRDTPRYRIAVDEFKPVSTNADAFLTQLDFQRTTFLAAVDKQTRAPEVTIDGKYRGALSYAVARAIEGAADRKGDGKITMGELFSYVRQLVYQISDERQNVVTLESPNRDPNREIVLQLTRGPEPALGQPPASERPALIISRSSTPIRLAPLNGRASSLTDIVALQSPFEIVSPDDTKAPPDIIWDPVSHDVISGGGDQIALGVDKIDLPAVIDRTATLRDIKQLVAKSPQALSVLPDASLHRRGKVIEVEVADAKGRALILVDVNGNGTLQVLYPMPYNQPILNVDTYRVPFQVRDPFGADEVIAVTSRQRMTNLEQALQQLDRRRSAGQLVDVISRFGPADARIGVVGLFTAP